MSYKSIVSAVLIAALLSVGFSQRAYAALGMTITCSGTSYSISVTGTEPVAAGDDPHDYEIVVNTASISEMITIVQDAPVPSFTFGFDYVTEPVISVTVQDQADNSIFATAACPVAPPPSATPPPVATPTAKPTKPPHAVPTPKPTKTPKATPTPKPTKTPSVCEDDDDRGPSGIFGWLRHFWGGDGEHGRWGHGRYGDGHDACDDDDNGPGRWDRGNRDNDRYGDRDDD